MKIYYSKKGTISLITSDDLKRKGKHILLPDDKVPGDFKETFALGKYLVKDGKLEENKEFQPPVLKGIIPEDFFKDVSKPDTVKPERKRKTGKKKTSTKKTGA